MSGHTLVKDSYARFEKLDDSVTTIMFNPIVTSGEEGEKKTDYKRVLKEDVFEVIIQ
ncbi:hypothetical protein [Bacillus cereus]|uniref:hypothetical protein n=1 Tax=Bacillus cereus TaxID=1396 RepID=UPI001596A151